MLLRGPHRQYIWCSNLCVFWSCQQINCHNLNVCVCVCVCLAYLKISHHLKLSIICIFTKEYEHFSYFSLPKSVLNTGLGDILPRCSIDLLFTKLSVPALVLERENLQNKTCIFLRILQLQTLTTWSPYLHFSNASMFHVFPYCWISNASA